MKTRIFLLILPVCILLSQTKDIPNKHFALQKQAAVSQFQYKQLDGNSLNCTIASDGAYADYRETHSAGLEWPKGTGKTPVFSAGFWLAGIHRPTGKIRMTNIDYTSEYQPGPIIGTFNTTSNADSAHVARATDSLYRLYKISKSDTLRGTDGKSLSGNIDFDEWPGNLGAPYEDRNGNGTWDAGIDMPKFYGDQQIWCVINDVNNVLHSRLSTSNPLGVEIQILYSAFNTTGPLNNTMFMRWKIINKSDADYDSVFFGLWSDPDLGDANDDLPGSDPSLNLGYVYNGHDVDAGVHGYGSTPPACGFDLLQGPLVPGGPDEYAMFNGKLIRGYRNLSSTSYSVYTGNVFSQIIDPPDANPEYIAVAYDYLNGKAGTIHQYLQDANGHIMKFLFSGDPVAGTGDLPSNFSLGQFVPQDIRVLLSSGSFTLAKGDTQEIVGAFTIAQGTDRLNSVTLLKAYDRQVQALFDGNNGILPSAAAAVSLSGSQAAIQITCSPHDTAVRSVEATIHASDDQTAIACIPLFDDGAHQDETAGDGVFGNSIVLPTQERFLVADFFLISQDSSRKHFSSLLDIGYTINRPSLGSPIFFVDNLNNDGKASPGENVRFGFSVSNPNAFTMENLTVRQKDNPAAPVLSISAIDSGKSYTMQYNISVPASYFVLTVPLGYSHSDTVLWFTITDSHFNTWTDSLIFPIYPFVYKYAAVQPATSVKLEGSFRILITDPSVLKNHSYLIQGVDSIDAQRTTGFTLRDETDNRTVLANAPLPDSSGYNILPIEGFKLFRGDIELKSESRSIDYSTNSWFKPTPNHARTYLKIFGKDSLALIPKGGYRKVQIQFAPIQAFVDTNSNGQWDYGEKVLFDTTSYGTSQKAFMLYQYSFMTSYGFDWVPFTAFDVETGTPWKLNIIVNDKNRNLRWDPKETIYIMPTSYDSTGITYNAAAGINLFAPPLYFEVNTDIRAFWIVQFDTVVHPVPYTSYSPMTLTPTYPLSSVNGFTFNPTIVLGVPSESEIPKEFSLAQNYPNPFNPTTVISYALPVMSSVKLVIYDLLGRQVATLVNEEQSAGWKQVQWNSSVSSGVYFYRLEAISRGSTARQFTQVRKMLLLR